MISKRISFYWSASKMSWLRYMTLFSFRKHHPDWEMFLYVNDSNHNEKPWNKDNHKQDFFNYKGEDYFEQVKLLDIKVINWECSKEILDMPPSHKSNLFKWEIMQKVGGVYSDMDIIYLRSIDGLLSDFISQNGDVGITYIKYFSIGFLMSSGNNNEVFKTLYETAVKEYMPNSYQGAGVMPMYNRWKGYGDMKKEFPKKSFYNIPESLFYYLGFSSSKELFLVDCFDEVNDFSLGVHWYAGGEDAQHFNNILNRDNYQIYDSTITRALESVLN